jgi:hypothetical protein
VFIRRVRRSESLDNLLIDRAFLDGTSPRIYPWNQSLHLKSQISNRMTGSDAPYDQIFCTTYTWNMLYNLSQKDTAHSDSRLLKEVGYLTISNGEIVLSNSNLSISDRLLKKYYFSTTIHVNLVSSLEEKNCNCLYGKFLFYPVVFKLGKYIKFGCISMFILQPLMLRL